MERMDRVNQQFKREISRIIHQDLADPRLGFVTIIRADVSRDLKNGKIYFTVLGDEQQAHEAQKGLDGARGMIRRLVGQRIKIRFTPEIAFVYDASAGFQSSIEQTIAEIKDGDTENHRCD